jgi:hypothetical protein
MNLKYHIITKTFSHSMLTHTASIQYAQVKISQPGVKIGQLKLSVTPVKGKNEML